MLKITIPAIESYDEINNEFISSNEQTLQLEHSLVSISKWESKWCKPFLQDAKRTNEEIIDYVRCMTLTQNVDPSVYNRLTIENFEDIKKYIDSPMTATWFSDDNSKRSSREIITSEIVYYWMIALNIPFECQKWHFNRLLTLIKVCNLKNSPPKKMSKRETLNKYKELNEARRKAANSNG